MAAILSLLLDIWKPIEGFPNYIVSNKGRVMSVNHRVRSRHKTRVQKGVLLNPNISNEGYCFVTLWSNNRPTRFRVHRLVAKAFLPNSDNLPQVNHRNYNRSDNRVENLEWCTAEYNMKYSNVLGCSNRACSKKVMGIKGDEVVIFSSLSEAERVTGVSHQNISACCNGSRISAGNYMWNYKD